MNITQAMSAESLSFDMNLIVAAVLNLFVSVNQFGISLHIHAGSENEEGPLVTNLRAVQKKAGDAIHEIEKLRDEIGIDGVSGNSLKTYMGYFTQIAATMEDGDLKTIFAHMLKHVSDKPDSFFDHFLDGMAISLIALKRLAADTETIFYGLYVSGKTSSFISLDGEYTKDSPSYKHHQMVSGHSTTVIAFTAVEILLKAVVAAEKKKPFMGVTYSEESIDLGQ